MKKFKVEKGQRVECAFCNLELAIGKSFFCKTDEEGEPLNPIICERCFQISYQMTKDVIDDRIMRKGGS